MPNLTGVSAMPRRTMRLVLLKAVIASRRARVVRPRLQFVDQRVDDVVDNRLVVGRDVVFFGAIEIGLADIERVHSEGIGHFLDEALCGDQPLRPAETAKGGVGDRVW